ncbi:hypothetical protein OG413_15670 [Streptomyces sp. NBC_01433]|uniref:hypothetical protein n=1 Tax=Streptomyces sp. NBC_01433 TaxID=2903864 RepID=UPI0022544384|nr:hypothetical protein [Streptomyces sp. NBC_01433]MCX4676723.1 hypothetical protein [Streptomyces sp. NBC_01433]
MTVTDRIRGSAVPAARAELDETLRRILATPSLAAQLLLAAADQLTTSRPEQTLTISGWGRTLARADQRVLSGYPQSIAQHAARRAMRALDAEMWATARTRGEWAICLRAAAKTV